MADNISIATTSTWSTAGNWSLGAAPVSTNNAYISAADSNQSFDTGLAQSGVTLASLNIDMSYTGTIGTAGTNGTNAVYLNIGATTFNIGTPAVISAGANGSRRLNIQAANSGAIINVRGSGASGLDTGFPPVRLLCTAAVLNVTGGSVGVAIDASETSSIATLKMESGFGIPSLVLGKGVTLTTGTVQGGTLVSYSDNAVTTMNVQARGGFVHYGTGAFTTMNVDAGTTVSYVGTGTITTLNLSGKIDFSQGTGAVTITNCNVYAGATINDPLGRVTFTNPFNTVRCRISDVVVNLGYNKNYQVS